MPTTESEKKVMTIFCSGLSLISIFPPQTTLRPLHVWNGNMLCYEYRHDGSGAFSPPPNSEVHGVMHIAQ